MKLMIRTQPALLDWRKTDAKQTTPAMPPDSLQLEINKPDIKMETTKPKVTIDQEQAFNESGLKSNKAFLADMVSRAESAVMEGIGHKVDFGNQLMSIETGVDVIAEQASYNAWERFYHQFGIVTMPSSGPNIIVQDGDVNYQFQRGSVKILNGPLRIDKGTYQAGSIDFYMKQKNSITITAVGDEVDITL